MKTLPLLGSTASGMSFMGKVGGAVVEGVKGGVGAFATICCGFGGGILFARNGDVEVDTASLSVVTLRESSISLPFCGSVKLCGSAKGWSWSRYLDALSVSSVVPSFRGRTGLLDFRVI